MKNAFKLLVIVALAAAFGLSFVSCGNSSNSSGGKTDSTTDKYYLAIFTVTPDVFESAFGASNALSSGQFKIFAGRVDTGSSNAWIHKNTSLVDSSNVLLADIRNNLESTPFTSGEVDQIINSLSSKQYVTAAKNTGGVIYVCWAFKDNL